MTGGLRGYRAEVAFDGERELAGGALVLVEGEVIVGVEPAAAAAPAGCPVAHQPGTALLPGLIDAHVHLCGDGSPEALDHLGELAPDELDRIITEAMATQLRTGVTAVRDLGDVDWVVADRGDPGPGWPHVVASGPPITSTAGHCANMGGAVSGRAGLLAAVRERADRGVSTIKIMASGGLMTAGTDVLTPQFTLEELRLVVDEAHQIGLPVTAHAHALPAVEQAVAAGVDGIEHCTCFTASGMYTPPELAERIAAAQIPVCPTVGRHPDAPIPPRVQEMLERTGLTWELRVAQVGGLRRAGVRLISGGDSGINPAKPHGILPVAVADLVAAGMSPAAALGSTTGAAADACRLAGRTGRLRPGLAADLLIVDGNPLVDIGALHAVRTVVARGREVDLTPR